MSWGLLYLDELKGFYKSKVVIVLWAGMPLFSIFIHLVQPDTEGLPLTSLEALILASIGGTLSSIILSTSIVNEKNRNVYELFLIRPVKRRNLLLAKYFAVYTCLVIAAALTLISGIIIDEITIGLPSDVVLSQTLDSLSISLAAMAISSAVGTLIGTMVSSVALAAILSVYVGNQLSMISILPGLLLESINPVVYAVVLGLSATVTIMIITVKLFERQQF